MQKGPQIGMQKGPLARDGIRRQTTSGIDRWRHEELTPLVTVSWLDGEWRRRSGSSTEFMGGDPRIAERPPRVWRAMRREEPVDPRGRPAVQGGAPSSIPAETPWRFDRLEFVEIEVDDGLQRLGGGAILKALGQDLEPLAILALEGEQQSDGIAPAPGTASAVGRSPVVDHRPGRGAGGAMPSLSLGIGHRFVAKGLARHGSTPKRNVTKPANRDHGVLATARPVRRGV